MKYCKNCGSQCVDEAKFCTSCGASFAEDQPGTDVEPSVPSVNQQSYQQQNYGSQNSYNTQGNYNSQNTSGTYGQDSRYTSGGAPLGSSVGIVARNIPLAIIFSIITCGIYGIYWMIKLNDEINQLAGETEATSGGMVFLFSLITCGIYGLYWLFKMGERCDRIKGTDGSLNVLYLVLGIFGLGIVDYCLMQDTLNKKVAQF